MSESGQFTRLFSPLQVGGRTLRNRIALPATLTNYGCGNRITPHWINFLAERAKGGAGMIITEILAVDPAALAQGAIITAFDAVNEDDFKATAAEVEGQGACLVGQLWHPGRQQLWSPDLVSQGNLRSAGRVQLDGPACDEHRRHAAGGRPIRRGCRTSQTLRIWRRGAARCARLSHHANSLALVQSTNRQIRWFSRKSRSFRTRDSARHPANMRQ